MGIFNFFKKSKDVNSIDLEFDKNELFEIDGQVHKPAETIKTTKGRVTFDSSLNKAKNISPDFGHIDILISKIDSVDPRFFDMGKMVIERDKASIGMAQRCFKIGFNQAARIMDQLAEAGVVGEEEGTRPRKILMTMEEFEYFKRNYEGRIGGGNTHPVTISKKEQIFIPEKVFLYNNKYDYMEGHDFEFYCAHLLQINGFQNVNVTQASGDQGIDIIALKGGVKYGIQCKCYSSDIGNKAVQEAFAGARFYDCHVPVVLTNQFFTSAAKELAQKTNVLLWDRNFLNDLINNESK